METPKLYLLSLNSFELITLTGAQEPPCEIFTMSVLDKFFPGAGTNRPTSKVTLRVQAGPALAIRNSVVLVSMSIFTAINLHLQIESKQLVSVYYL